MPADLRREARAYGRDMDRAELSGDEVARLRARIHERVGRRRRSVWLRVAAPAAAAATAVVTVAVLWWSRPEPTWSVSNDRSGCATIGAGGRLQTDRCAEVVTVAQGGDRVEVEPGSEIDLRGPRRVRLRSGRARFRVTPRAEVRFRVRVAVGSIEVVGTEFDVWQNQDRGGVRVHRGAVVLTLDRGGAERLTAGASRQWLDDTAAEAAEDADPTGDPPEKSQPPRPRKGKHKATSQQRIDELLHRQFQLRAQGRFEDALAELRAALADPSFPRRQKVRVSLEIGRVLEQKGSTESACRHWRRHRARFGRHSLDADAARFLAECP